MVKYIYIGSPGIYNGISVNPNGIYELKNPNPKLFKEIKNCEIKKPEIKEEKEFDVFSFIKNISGIGFKAAKEVAEEYDNLIDLKRDLEDGTFSVGGLSVKKIEIIKKEINKI